MDITSFVLGMKVGKSSGGSGGGSGGGTLPPGVYVTPNTEIKQSTSYIHQRFKYNGSIYEAKGTVHNAGYAMEIVKWNGSAWETVMSSTASNGWNGFTPFEVGSGVEYNGKLHVISSNGKNHGSFDLVNGTHELVSTLPKTKDGGGVWVLDGVLYTYLYGDYGVYAFDDSTATWNLAYTLSSLPDKYAYMRQVGDEVYIYSYKFPNGYFYRLNGTTAELLGSVNGSYSSSVVINGEIWAYPYKYNPVTRTETQYPSLFSGMMYWDIGTNELAGNLQTRNGTSSYYAPAVKVHIIEE